MIELLPDALADRYVYLLVVVLLAIGLWGMLAKRNLLHKAIGLTIYSTAIYLFFIEGSVRENGTVPVLQEPYAEADPSAYVDPVPHLLILTAIVVGVGVLGVALALLVRIHETYGTLDEDELVARLSSVPTALVPDREAHEGAADDDAPSGDDDGGRA